LLSGGGKQSDFPNWGDRMDLADQFEGDNFEVGNVGIYKITCQSLNCPEDDTLSQICLQIVAGGPSKSWCPANVRVFSYPDFKALGQTDSFPRVEHNGEPVCMPLVPVPSLPTPPAGAERIKHVTFWADFGVPRAYGHLYNEFGIQASFPNGLCLTNGEGGFSLYSGFADYVINQGKIPDTLFLLGDNGYLGGMSSSLQYAVNDAGIRKSTDGKLPSSSVFPAIGNHDINGPSGCATGHTEEDLCYYGMKANLVWKAKRDENFGFEEWNHSWFYNFPGLGGGQVVIPESTMPGVRWQAPYRYNVDLGDGSVVYFIVGLAAGANLNQWGERMLPVGLPVSKRVMNGDALESGDMRGVQTECKFLEDSLLHGESLGKRIFVYLTHDGPHPVWQMPQRLSEQCEENLMKVDVWLFGHEHFMGLSVPHGSTVDQEKRRSAKSPPVRFLLGNGGYDEGEEMANTVSFVAMEEYHDQKAGRVQLYFQAYDTCVSNINCASPSKIQNWPAPDPIPRTCWRKCIDFSDGYENRKALKSINSYAFIYEAQLNP